MDLKFHPIHYKPPIKDDMAVVLVFFNPQRSIRIVQNIITVVHYLKSANIPYFIHELAFNDEPHIFAPAPNIKLSRSTSYMFYKENLIHTLLPSIPEKYTKICIMDADIMFDEPFWYTIISATLDTCDICQPFTTAYFLGPNFKPEKERTNSVDSTANKIYFLKEHTGHIWAFNRDWYDQSGIPDTSIIGGGDLIITTSIRGIQQTNNNTFCLYKDIIPTDLHTRTVRKSCDLNIYHLFHGLGINRQYTTRTDTLVELFEREHLTLTTSFTRRKDGILEWAPEKRSTLNEFMINYFNRRNDDLVTEDFMSTNKKFVPQPYIYPTIQDMAVVLVFFNPVKHVRVIQNILTMIHWLDNAKIPYYIAEVVYDTKASLFKSSNNIFTFLTDSVLFHKENLISIIEKKLPLVYTKFCTIDADILFEQTDWYTTISRTLDSYDVCQPFRNAIWLHPDYTEFRRRTNCLDSSGSSIIWDIEHPGFLWAFKRSWYNSFPYRTIHIPTIGGDTILHDLIKQRISGIAKYYKKYYDEINALRIPIRYASGNLDIIHLNHGSYSNRLYPTYITDALKELGKCGISTFYDAVIQREDGLLEWKSACKVIMNKFNMDYFTSRCDDDI